MRLRNAPIIFVCCPLLVRWRDPRFPFLISIFGCQKKAQTFTVFQRPMLRNGLRMSSSIPRGGRGAGRAVRRHNSKSYHASAKHSSPAAALAVKPVEPVEPATKDRLRHFSDHTFEDAPISAASKSGIKHQHLSDVQAATLQLGLAGKDILVQAKTGTGKTMAFLLPTVERLAKLPRIPPAGQISALILSPTRELALQVGTELRNIFLNKISGC